MRKYTYSSPKIKSTTRLINVVDENDHVVCKFKRVYNNFIERIADSFLGFDYFVQFNVFSNDGKLLYQGKKISRWGKTQYQVINCNTNEKYHITFKSWQVIVPEFHITSNSEEYVVKKELMGWAKFYFQGKEVARWKMKTTELFKTYLEIDDDCPIQEPEFFVCLFQCIFYIGD